jgi:N-acetylgalactosamine-6-sulfatase
LIAAVIAICWGAPDLARGAEGKAPPNVVFILADDLGWGDLGCYGNKDIPTPHIDKLAKQGTLFTHFYGCGSVCSPSRCALLTGQFPARHAIHSAINEDAAENRKRGVANWLDPTVPTLPAVLKQAGYATGHFGKWHLGMGSGAPSPQAYGLDDVRVVLGNAQGWEKSAADLAGNFHSTARFVDETIRFIKANKHKPFYVNLWTLVPHATLNPPPEQMKPFEEFGPGDKAPNHKGARTIYYASVADLDKQVGRLLAALDDLGLAANTIVVFSSDNGPEDILVAQAGHSGVGSAGPFRGRKRSLYEGGIRVPFIVRWPAGTAAGKVDDTSVLCGADLMPTVCQLAAAPLPKGYAPDGEDMSAAFLGKPTPRTRPITWEWRFNIVGHVWNVSPVLAIRDEKWKLLMNPDRGRMELYDIPADPTEQTNLAEKHPGVVARLSDALLAWQAALPKGPYHKNAGTPVYPWPTSSDRSHPPNHNPN